MAGYKTKNNLQLHALLAPAAALALVFNYAPMFGLVIAFQDFKASKGLFGSPFIGFEHFRQLFEAPEVGQIIMNTLFFSIAKIVLLLLVPFIFALLVNEAGLKIFKNTVRTITCLPHFLSWVILSGILVDMLKPDGGIVNRIIVLFAGKPVFFLANGSWFRFIVVATAIWKEFGFSAIIIFAAIACINPSMYESSYIDGANRWHQAIYITVPSLYPVLTVILTLNLGNILNGDFDQIFNMYNSLIMDKADIIDTYVYRMGLLNLNYGFSAAVGMLKSLVSFLLFSAGYWFACRFAGYRVF